MNNSWTFVVIDFPLRAVELYLRVQERKHATSDEF